MDLDPKALIRAYASGLFPMASSRRGRIAWYRPEQRAVLELANLRISRSLRKTLSSGRFSVSYNRAFAEVIAACADRQSTWISHDIERAYNRLHEEGFAHSVEVWEGDCLVGGLYGVGLGGVFCGESMFSRESDASKTALVYLVRLLERRGFVLLDCQILNDHMESLGATQIPAWRYARRLQRALSLPVTFCDRGVPSGWFASDDWMPVVDAKPELVRA